MPTLLKCTPILLGLWLSGNPALADTLVEHYQCNECHGADDAAIAPAYTDIAGRYADDSEARARLVAVVKNGGKGMWPKARGVVMPPYYADMSDAEIAQVVDWILNQ